MNEGIKERIRLILSAKEISETKLANLIGVAQINVNRWLKGVTMPTEFVVNILSLFPDISAEWLLRGEGEMIKDATGFASEQGWLDKILSKIPTCGDEAFYEKEISRLLDENMKLRKEQSRLTAIVESINNNSQA